MATYTFTVFKWSGTGYNAQYDTSYDAVIQDDDVSYEGGSDADEQISIDGGAFSATSSVPYAIDVSFTDTDGVEHVETFQFMYTGGSWYFAPGADSAFSEGARLGNYQSHTTGWDYATVTCFAAGTMISAPIGQVAVEDIRAGDNVCDIHGAVLSVAQVLSREIGPLDLARRPKLRPIRIGRGALGKGVPERDLIVSRQHRIMIQTPSAKPIVGSDSCLVAACRLVGLPGVTIEPATQGVRYYHIAVAGHAVLRANGAPAESFYPGAQALRGLPQSVVNELRDVFGADVLRAGQVPLAQPCPSGPDQKRIVARLARTLA